MKMKNGTQNTSPYFRNDIPIHLSILGIFRIVFSLLFITGNFLYAKEPIVEKLIIIGNEHTRESYLRHFILSTEGASYDTTLIEEDHRRLKNLTSVLDSKWYSLQNESGYTLIYIITERFTILPVGDFGIAKGNYYFGFGAMETNAFGRGVYLYGFYRYNQQHSFHGIVRWPYLAGTKWGFEIQGQQWNDEEPYYMFDEKKHYEKNFTNLYVAARYEFEVEHDINVGFYYRNERYNLSDTSESTGWKPTEHFAMFGLRTEYNLQHISYNRFRLDGWDNQLIVQLQREQNNQESYLTLRNTLKLFKRFGSRGNLALRNIIGVSSPRFDPFATFTLDNFDNIRGIGYHAKRGNALLCLNTEYRTTLYSDELIAIQLNIFVDVGSVRAYQWSTSDWLTPNNYEMFVGPGVKILALQAHGATLSLDYGFKTTNFKNSGLVFTVGQYF